MPGYHSGESNEQENCEVNGRWGNMGQRYGGLRNLDSVTMIQIHHKQHIPCTGS